MRTDFWIRNKIMPRNHDIAELRRLDIAHHLPAQADWAEIESLGGSRIITHAEGCYIHDGDGHRILDGMAGLWCVNVGYGRGELVEAAAAQMRELHFYNTFFKTATPPTVRPAERKSELQSLMRTSYAVLCLKKKTNTKLKKYIRLQQKNKNKK